MSEAFALPQNPVRAECKRRFGNKPCIKLFDKEGHLTQVYECVEWCPALQKLIPDDADQSADLASS